MKFKGDRPFATPEAAEQKLLELANAIEADHAGGHPCGAAKAYRNKSIACPVS